MKSVFKLGFMTLLVALFLSGCIATGNRLNYSNINQIQRGVTTEQQIRAMFGEPVTLEVDHRKGIKKLTYSYSNSDDIKKGAATLAGAVAGGWLGSQIGGGSGSVVAGTVGAVAGGTLAENAVTSRRESQDLEVMISLHTGRVVDFNFHEQKRRSQSWGLGSGVNPL